MAGQHWKRAETSAELTSVTDRGVRKEDNNNNNNNHNNSVSSPSRSTSTGQHHVHRSFSLQQQRRPRSDRSNSVNYFNAVGGSGGSSSGSSYYSCGNFQLANLLARAASYDAKWRRELSEHGELPVESSPFGGGGGGGGLCPVVVAAAETTTTTVGSVNTADEQITLPPRYLRLTRRRQHHTDESDQNQNTSEDVTDGDKRPSRDPDVDAVADADDESSDDRERDLSIALQWIRQEIRSLKMQDRTIMRQLFQLGTTVRQLNGALSETISCQTVASPHVVAHDTLDVINDVTEDDVTMTFGEDCDNMPEDGAPLDSQCRAVSMVTVNRSQSSAKKKLTFSAIAQRVRSMKLFHRSADQFVE